MNVYLGILIGSLLTLLALLPVVMLSYRRFMRRQIEAAESNRQDWENLLYDLNHNGPAPEGASKVGLSRLVIMSLNNNIESLQRLLEVKDWDTTSVIERLIDTRDEEATMLFHLVSKNLETWRKVIKKYDYKQNNKE